MILSFFSSKFFIRVIPICCPRWPYLLHIVFWKSCSIWEGTVRWECFYISPDASNTLKKHMLKEIKFTKYPFETKDWMATVRENKSLSTTYNIIHNEQNGANTWPRKVNTVYKQCPHEITTSRVVVDLIICTRSSLGSKYIAERKCCVKRRRWKLDYNSTTEWRPPGVVVRRSNQLQKQRLGAKMQLTTKAPRWPLRWFFYHFEARYKIHV